MWLPNRSRSNRRSTVSQQPPISGTTALVGVLGDPVHHSLSPVMQNAALRAMGLDWVFLALPAPAGELATVVRALEALECRGLNVTIPHKHNVAALCRELSPLAQRLGAVNVLVPLEGGGWHGTNTDVEGFCAPLQRDGRPWGGERAVVLGCGGSRQSQEHPVEPHRLQRRVLHHGREGVVHRVPQHTHKRRGAANAGEAAHAGSGAVRQPHLALTGACC